ncbi:Rieske 2Fe-2S domain-containing protein [Mesorhizobium sophorae]|uniref:Rieske 2Fe-2S domain-containing protein n=1 Tax=Mesorhizobium sophorae TaxID=1300294 RepID=UPI003CC9C1F1
MPRTITGGEPLRWSTHPAPIYVIDGLCTDDRMQLAGEVMDCVLACPKHKGRFGCHTGKCLKAPICVDLAIYEASVEDGRVFLRPSRT